MFGAVSSQAGAALIDIFFWNPTPADRPTKNWSHLAFIAIKQLLCPEQHHPQLFDWLTNFAEVASSSGASPASSFLAEASDQSAEVSLFQVIAPSKHNGAETFRALFLQDHSQLALRTIK